MIHGVFVSEEKERKIVEQIFHKVSLTPLMHSAVMDDGDSLIQALVYEGNEDNRPTAAACMVLKQEEARIISVAVLPEYRGKSYGEFLIRMLIDKAKTSGIPTVNLCCDVTMAGYFQKFGFNVSEDGKEQSRIVCINMTYEVIDGKCCSKST